MARETAPKSLSRRIWVAVAVFALVGLLFVVIGMLMLATASTPSPTMSAGEQFTAGSLVAFAGAAGVGGAAALAWVHRRRARRLRQAAQMGIEHGWHVRIEGDPREHPASAFGSGSIKGSWLETPMHLHEPRYIEVGNYVFDAGQSGLGRSSVGWIAIELDRRLPHMYLFSQSTPHQVRPYNVPIFSADQRLDLEGDFNTHFRLFCPREYATDALYVITPDVMALMIDEAQGFDIEIVDDMLFVVARRPFDMSDSRILEFAQRLAATLGARTARQGARYVDHRSGDPVFIAHEGARLARRPVLAILTPLLVTAAVVALAGWFGGLFG